MLFACIFVPDFPAASIMRSEPELRGGVVAVVEGKPPLLNVVSANERARQIGVEIGMTKLQAEARLAGVVKGTSEGNEIAVIRQRSVAQEKTAHAALADCARAMSPRAEEPEDAPDMVLLDLHGLDRLFGTPRAIAVELVRRAAQVGLEANVAACANLDTAICAARGFAGVTVIGDGTAAERLGPLGLHVLLESAGDSRLAREFLETFDRWGVRTCRAFAALPEVAVAQRLGTEGVRFQRLARGEGTRTLAPIEAAAEFEEVLELEYPIEDMESLAFVLNRLIEQLCARLSARALSTNELRLRMKLQPKHESVSVETDKYERSIRLPVPMLDAKTFLRLWQLELRGNPPGAPVEKMHLRAEAAEPRSTQGGLFLPAAPEPERLEITLARITAIVRGNSNHEEMRAGSAEVLDTHAPDAFRMKRFVADASGDERRDTTAQSAQIKKRMGSRAVLRRLRPPARIKVEVREGQPVRIRAIPEFLPSENEISWCAGPWRVSGEWWKDAWARDEWDVVIGDLSCRIYRDTAGDWFLEGTYD